MDEDRRIRFFVSPALLAVALVWAAMQDPIWKIPQFSPSVRHAVHFLHHDAATAVAGAIAAGGTFVFAAGYVIGTITNFVLRTLFLLYFWICPERGSPTHEACFDSATLDAIARKIFVHGPIDRASQLFASVTFDYGHLAAEHDGIHRWLVRRWSAFSIAATSVTAILLAGALCELVGITLSWRWLVPFLLLSAVLAIAGCSAWRDGMRMVGFQAILCNLPANSTSPQKDEPIAE